MPGGSHKQQLDWAAGQQKVTVVGSTSLIWANLSKELPDPAEASLRLWDQAFRVAKSQLDNDLQQFTSELQHAVAEQQVRLAGEGDEATTDAWQLARLVRIVAEFLSLKDASFQSSLPEVISWLHHERGSCSRSQARLKCLYSRLLFLLSRCSRLLIPETDEQRSSNALAAFAAGPKAGGGTSAKSGRLSFKLRQLLYGDSRTRLMQQSSNTNVVTAAGGATSSSPFEDHERALQQQLSEGEEEDFPQQPPVGSKKTRRKSAIVSFQSPVGSEGGVDPEVSHASHHKGSQWHRMKRCNTMPVQQAEAMQQLLHQVDHSDRSDSSQAGACYPLRPSAESTRPAADVPDMHDPQQHSSRLPQQQHTVLSVPSTTCGHKRSMELSDFIAVQSAVQTGDSHHGISWATVAENKQGSVTPTCSPVPVQVQSAADADAADNLKSSATEAPGSLADFCDPLVQAQLRSVDIVKLSGQLHVMAQKQQQQQLLATQDAGAGAVAGSRSVSLSSNKSSKGWLKKQWRKMQLYAKGLKYSEKSELAEGSVAPLAGSADLAADCGSNATAVDSGSSMKSNRVGSWLSRSFLGSKKTRSYVTQPSMTRSIARSALPAKSTVHVTSDLLKQLHTRSAPAAAAASGQHQWLADSSQNTEIAADAEAGIGLPAGQQQTQDWQQVGIADKDPVTTRSSAFKPAESTQSKQPQHNRSLSLQQQVQQPQQQLGGACLRDPPAGAVAADLHLMWDHQQRDMSPARLAAATAAASAAAAQGILYVPVARSAPNSRSHSLDGGSRLGQLHAPRHSRVPVSTALSSTAAVPQPAACRVGWHQPGARLHCSRSRSSGQLSADACASMVATAAAAAVGSSWQQHSPGSTGGALKRTSSGLGVSRHGNSRLSGRASGEPSRLSLQQQRQQAAAGAGQGGQGTQPLMQQQVQLQRQGSSVLPGAALMAGAVWLDAIRAGDAALCAVATQQPHRDANAAPAAESSAVSAAGILAAAGASASPSPASVGTSRPITPGIAAEYCISRPASPATALAAQYEPPTSAIPLSISRCQSVGCGLIDSEHGHYSPAASSNSGSYHSGTVTPRMQAVYAAGMFRKGPLAAAAGGLLGSLPGHRTCYYSESGAVHVAVPAAAATAALEVPAAAVALQARTIKCALCSDEVLAVATKSHNDLCGVLTAELSKLKGSASTADARLTTLANWMEEQLMHCVWPEVLSGTVQQIIDVARLVASLQPDGTGTPEVRCEKAIEQVDFVLAQWHAQMQALTLSESNAELLAEGVADCDIVVTLCSRLNKQMQDKLKWLAEPLPGATCCQATGATTPRTTPVMQVSDFEMICPISRGAYGRVYKVKKKLTGDTFAIKVLTKTELVKKNMVESVTNERNILAMANNPFVVRFYYSFSSPEKLFLVMEYCPGGDLSSLLQHLGRFDEDTARQYLAETVLALEYCHSKGIIHRDLKPDNLLVSSTGHIKLSDFGLSKFGGAAAAEGAAAAAAGPLGQSPSDCTVTGSTSAGESSREQATGGSSSSKSTPNFGRVAIDTPDATDEGPPCVLLGAAAAAAAAAGSGEEQQTAGDSTAAAGCCTTAGAEEEQQCRGLLSQDGGCEEQTVAGSRSPASMEQLAVGMSRPPSLGILTQAAAVAAVSNLSSSCSIMCSGNQQQRHHQQQQEGSSGAQQQSEHSPAVAAGDIYRGSIIGQQLSCRKRPTQLVAAAAAAAALARVRGNSESFMSPASQAVKACQITSMIPHTSLPSSPAVFGPTRDGGTSGSIAAGRDSGRWCLSPKTPAPMLQQLAADLSSAWGSEKSSMTGTTSSATAAAAVDDSGGSYVPGFSAAETAPRQQGLLQRCPKGFDLTAVGGLKGGVAAAGLNVPWRQGTDGVQLSTDRPEAQPQQQQQIRHPARAATAQHNDPGNAAGVNSSDPAAAIGAEVAEPVSVGQAHSAADAASAREDSWQHQLWQQPQQQVSGAYQQQQDPSHGLSAPSDADAADCAATSCKHLADFVNAAAQQQVSIQRHGCGSFSISSNGRLQQPATVLPLCSRTMSAPVSAVQLQRRLQAVSDRLQRQEQQQLACGRRSTTTSKQISTTAAVDSAAIASLEIMAAEQHQQPPIEAVSQGRSTSLTAAGGSQGAPAKASLQKSLSVALPPELLTPEDAMQVCMPADPYQRPQGTTGFKPSGTGDSTAAAWTSSVTPHDALQGTLSDPIQQQQQQQKSKTAEAAAAAKPAGSSHPQEQHVEEGQCGAGSKLQTTGQQTMIVKPKLKHASQVTQRALGTPDYLAPERLIGMAYGPEVDWWALGVILYEFVYGAPPFNADTPQEIFERILDCNVDFPLDEDGEHVVSEECRDLIKQLLQGDPERRLGHRGAGEVKMHSWFQGVEWETLARQKAAFVPLDNADTKDYFVEKPFSKLSIAADLEAMQSSPPDKTSKQGSGPPSGSAVARAPAGVGCPQQQLLQHSLSSSAAGCFSAAADAGVCSSTPSATAATIAVAASSAGGSGCSSASGMVTPAVVALHQAAGGAWGHKTWPAAAAAAPAATPRSARGSTPKGTVLPVPPAFIAPNGVILCSTPSTPGSSSSQQQQRQQQPAANHSSGGLSPAAYTSPLGVAALTGSSSLWPNAAAATLSAHYDTANRASVLTAAAAASSNTSRFLSTIISPRAAVVGGVYAGAAVAGSQQQRRRCSASQVEHQLHLVRQQQRWSSRQLGSYPGSPFAHQQSADALVAQAPPPLPPRQRRSSGTCGDCSPAVTAATFAAAGSGGTGSSASSSAHVQLGGVAAVAAASLEAASTAAYELSTWGSLYSSPGSSAGGGGGGGAAAAAIAPSCSPPEQQQQTADDAVCSLPQATPGDSTTASPADSSDTEPLSLQQQQQQVLLVGGASAAGLSSQENWQQQEQQRKARKSNCSSPQQRLKHQWAQQRLLQQLQQQQQQDPAAAGNQQQYPTGCSIDSFESCLASDATVCVQPTAVGSSSSRELANQSSRDRFSPLRFADGSSEGAAAVTAVVDTVDPATDTLELCDTNLRSPPAGGRPRSNSPLLGDPGAAADDQQGPADTHIHKRSSSKSGTSPEKVKAGRSNGSITPPGWFCHSPLQSLKAQLQLGSLSARSPPQTPRSPKGRVRHRSAAAYTALSIAAAQAAAAVVVMECQQTDVDWPRSPTGTGGCSSIMICNNNLKSSAAALHATASLADWQARDFRASVDDTGLHSSATFALDSCRQSLQDASGCFAAAAAVDVPGSSCTCSIASESLQLSDIEPESLDASAAEAAGQEMQPQLDWGPLSRYHTGDLCPPAAAASFDLQQQQQAIDDYESQQSCSEDEGLGSPSFRCPFSFSTWQPGSQPPPSSAAVSGRHAVELLLAPEQQQQQGEQLQHWPDCTADGTNNSSSSIYGPAPSAAGFSSCSHSCYHSADGMSAFAAASSGSSNGATAAVSRHDSSGFQGQTAAQVDDVDAFGDFVSVNVGALQELNIEKQHAELLGPIQQAVSSAAVDCSTAAAPIAAAAAAVEAASTGPGMAAVHAAQAEVQYHQVMLAQYAAAAGATSPLIDYEGFAEGLPAAYETDGGAEAAAYEQHWQLLNHQHCQQQQQQGYDQFYCTAGVAAGSSGGCGHLLPGMYPRGNLDEHDPFLLAQNGQGPALNAAAAAAAAAGVDGDDQQDIMCSAAGGGFLGDASGMVHAVDAATGRLVLLDAANTQWVIPVDGSYGPRHQQDAGQLQQGAAVHEAEQFLLLPYAMLAPDGTAAAHPYLQQQQITSGDVQQEQQQYALMCSGCEYPQGYMSEPLSVLDERYKLDTRGPVSAQLHYGGYYAVSRAASPAEAAAEADFTFADLVEAGLLAHNDPKQQQQQQPSGSDASKAAGSATGTLASPHQQLGMSPPGNSAAAAAAEGAVSSSSKECGLQRASLSANHCDQLSGSAGGGWHGHPQQQQEGFAGNQGGSWPDRGDYGPLEQEGLQHPALMQDSLLSDSAASSGNGLQQQQQNLLCSGGTASLVTMFHPHADLGQQQQQQMGITAAEQAAQQFMSQQPAAPAWSSGAYTARLVTATLSEDGAIRMISRGNSSCISTGPWAAAGLSPAAAATTTRLSRHSSGSMPCMFPLDVPGVASPGFVSAFAAAAAAENASAAAATPGALYGGGLGFAGGFPAADKDFLAQLGAIATDGPRGYKYRASDSGREPSSFLQRAATASLPGSLSAAVSSSLGAASGANGSSSSHRSTVSRTPTLAPTHSSRAFTSSR